MHSFEAPCMPRRVESNIIRAARFADRSGLSLWIDGPEKLQGASVAQIQLLRAAAKALRRQPWRDNIMQGDRLMSWTHVELWNRGAISPHLGR